MDHESVTEFLGDVPLLQRLPSSSLRKIAQVVEFKYYDAGDLIVREGETGDGVYFIWEGDAEVSGNDNDGEGNQLELHLKKYDYFGYGVISLLYMVHMQAQSTLVSRDGSRAFKWGIELDPSCLELDGEKNGTT